MDVQPDIPWTLDAITDDWLDAALRESGVLGEACVIGFFALLTWFGVCVLLLLQSLAILIRLFAAKESQ